MHRRPIDTSFIQPPRTRIDYALEGTMAALFAFMPLAFGVVEAWSEMIALALVTLAAALLIVKSFTSGERRGVASTWAYLPLALLILFVAFQLVPLPGGLIGSVSSNTLGTRAELLDDLSVTQRAVDNPSLSFYSPATRQMLRVVLLASAVFAIALNLYRTTGQIKRILALVSCVGAGIAIIALVQDAADARAIYGKFPIEKWATGGTFVNDNHFAQFMNLSIGAMLALLFLHLRDAGLSAGWTSRLLDEHRPLLLLAVGVVLCAAALFVSGSRGGMISLLAAFAVTAIVASAQRDLPGRGWAVVIVGLGIFAAVAYTSLDWVAARLGTLQNVQQASGARWQMNQDVLQLMVPKFPLFGIGLGAHEVVYPMYSRLPDAGLATHVENEYLQLLEETGILGVLIVLAFLAIIVTHYVRLVRRPTHSTHAAALGLGYGLVAVAVHSLSDFGQRIPANLCLSMLFGALLISLSRIGKAQTAPAPVTTAPWRPKFLGVAGSLLLLVALGWATFGAVKAANAEAHWNQALTIEDRLAADGWTEASNEDLAELITLADVAVQNVPDDVHYRYGLNLYRWQAISREIDPETGNFVMDKAQLGHAARIADELHATRPLCPTFGPVLSLLGQIELFVLGKDSGEQHIRDGYRLAPLDPTASFVAARLDASKGQWDEALSKFRRCVELGHPAEDVIDAYVRELNNPQQALAFAERDGDALLYLAQLLAERKDVELASKARLAAIDALKEDVRPPNGSYKDHASLADLLFNEKKYTDAVEHYAHALAGDYGNVTWRLRRAEALAAAGQVQEAMKEAKVCQRLRPESTSVAKLIEQLSLQPGASAE